MCERKFICKQIFLKEGTVLEVLVDVMILRSFYLLTLNL